MHRNEQIAVMLNKTTRGKMPAGASAEDWRRFNAAFQREETTARGLAAEIWRGYSFAPVYGSGRRLKENFQAAWHIALDFDTGDARSSLQRLAADQFADWFASFAYTTPSHTAAAPRARLVFVFPHDDPITDIDEYEALYRALLWRYPAADQATKDAVRLFYGSPDCEVWANWSIFPGPARQVAIDQYLEHVAATASPPPAVAITGGDYHRYAERALERRAESVATAAPGERHKALWAAGLLIGELWAADWSGVSDIGAEVERMTSAATWATGQGDQLEVKRVLEDGAELGKTKSRPAPARTMPHVRDLT